MLRSCEGYPTSDDGNMAIFTDEFVVQYGNVSGCQVEFYPHEVGILTGCATPGQWVTRSELYLYSLLR